MGLCETCPLRWGKELHLEKIGLELPGFAINFALER